MWHLDQLKPLDDILARWLLLLGMVDARKPKVYEDIYKELEELAMQDEHLREAFNEWELLSKSPEETAAYLSRLKYILDEETKFDYAHQKGIEQGIEQGEERMQKKIALQMLRIGKSEEEVEELLGLPLQEIQRLREK